MKLESSVSSLHVCEIFYSIQGESTHAGRPCIFLRLAGCSSRCTWCDTPYAWSPNDGEEMTFSQILYCIGEYPTKLIEITGGEPLEQESLPLLLTLLQDNGFEVLLETNGGHSIEKVRDYCHLVMDVKCPDSGVSDIIDLKNLQFLKKSDELKFVIASKNDFKWAVEFIMSHELQNRVILLFSPAYEIASSVDLAHWLLTSPISSSRARLQLQMHKSIWPIDRRGV